LGVFVVVTYVVKPEKQAEFMPCMQRIYRYVKENPEKFKEWKSFKLLSHHMSFDIIGQYMELWEFENVADLEKCMTRLSKDKGWMKCMHEIASLIDPVTFSMNLWNAVE